jgi:O-antigen/teichoic acid export membrane protein
LRQKKRGKLDKKISVFREAPTDEAKSKRFSLGALLSFLGLSLGGVLTAGWTVVMTRLLGPADFGILGPIFQAFWLLTLIATVGIHMAITTYAAHHWENEREKARNFSSDGNKLIFAIGICLLVVSFVILVSLFLLELISGVVAAIGVSLALAIFTNAQFWGINHILLGAQRTDHFSVGHFSAPFGALLSSTLFVILAQWRWGEDSRMDIAGGMLGFAIGGATAWAIARYLLRKTDIGIFKALYDYRKKAGLYKKIIKFGGMTCLAHIGYTFLNTVPMVVVGLFAARGVFAATLEESLVISGHFSAAFLYGSIPLALMGITFPIISAMSEAEAQGRKDLVQHYLNKILWASFAILGGVLIVYFFAGGRIAELFAGREFPAERLHPIVVLAALGITFTGLNFVLFNSYIGLKKPNYAAIAMAAGAVLQVIAITAAIRIYGNIIMVSIFFLVASVLTFLITAYFLLPLKLKITPALLIVPAVCALIASVMTQRFFPLLAMPEIWLIPPFILQIAVLLIMYVVLFLAMNKAFLKKYTEM